jgi:Holliday junction DNA helicase RuvA
LLAVDDATILVDVGGVGYEVDVTVTMLAQLPRIGETVTVHTHLNVREDDQSLFGFHSRDERDLFRSLIRVNGVGPKVALGLLSGISVADFARCVTDKDIGRLTKVPGIGKKTAERVVLDLEGRVDHLVVAFPRDRAATPAGAASRVVEEAESALIALGYRPVEASRAVADAFEEGRSTEEVVRLALKKMVSKSA